MFFAVGLGAAGLLHSDKVLRGGGVLVPLGACVVTLVAIPVARVTAMRDGGALVLSVVFLLIAAAGIVHVARTRPDGRRPTRSRIVLVAVPAALAGAIAVAALAPVLAEGFATTLSYANFDGWYFATHAEWLQHHTWGNDLATQNDDPLTAAAVWSDTYFLPVGVDVVVAYVMAILGSSGYAVLGAFGASAFVVAACGWFTLAQVVRHEQGWSWPAVVALFAVVNPLFALMYAESYMAQLWGCALWPFLIAAAIQALRQPTWRSLLLAAVALAATVSIYPGNLPWVGLGLVAAGLMAMRHRQIDQTLGVAGALGRTGVAAAGMLALAALLAPLQVMRTIDFTRFAQGIGDAPPLRAGIRGVTAVLLGTQSSPLAPVPTWRGVVVLALLVGTALALLAPLIGRQRRPPLVPVLAGAVLLATLVVYSRYAERGFAYLMTKSLMTGSALLAGLILIGLASSVSHRSRALFAVTSAGMVLVWGAVAAVVVERTRDGIPGVRTADRAFGERLSQLGPDDVALIEGAAERVPLTYHYRMATAYFAATTARDNTTEGLGSTSSYLTSPGLQREGSDFWRPTVAWTHVVTQGDASLIVGRNRLWTNDAYTLWRAPIVDVTTYGLAWQPPVRRGDAWFQRALGPAEILVSNRSQRARAIDVSVALRSVAVPRRVALLGGSRPVSANVPAGVTTVLQTRLVVPAGRVGVLQISPQAIGQELVPTRRIAVERVRADASS